MSYTRVNWKDGSGNAGGDTPVSAANLNVMDAAIAANDVNKLTKAGDTMSGNLTLDSGNATSPAAIFNDSTHTSRAYFQLVNEVLELFTTYRNGTNALRLTVDLNTGIVAFGAPGSLSFSSGNGAPVSLAPGQIYFQLT